jgi:hypothetical protein
MAALFAAAAIGAAAITPIGCGAGDVDSFFTNDPDYGLTTSNGSGSTSAATSTSGPGGTGGNGVGGMGATSSGVGGNPSSSTAGVGGSGGAPIEVTVACGGGQTCPVTADSACCWHEDSNDGQCVQGPPDMNGCDTSFQGNETLITCQSDKDCATGLCCGDRDNGSNGTYYSEVSCQAACPDITLCDTLGEMAPDCPVITTMGGQMIQTVCEQSGLLPTGFLVCGNP